jgi:hypothetical protein
MQWRLFIFGIFDVDFSPREKASLAGVALDIAGTVDSARAITPAGLSVRDAIAAFAIPTIVVEASSPSGCSSTADGEMG